MTDVEPALTDEEWGEWFAHKKDLDRTEGKLPDHDGIDLPNHPHALAATSLHDQEFGFTREDVNLLHIVANHHFMTTGGYSPGAAPFLDLADRIAALLPPRENAG